MLIQFTHPSGSCILMHQNLRAHALLCHNSLAEVNFSYDNLTNQIPHIYLTGRYVSEVYNVSVVILLIIMKILFIMIIVDCYHGNVKVWYILLKLMHSHFKDTWLYYCIELCGLLVRDSIQYMVPCWKSSLVKHIFLCWVFSQFHVSITYYKGVISWSGNSAFIHYTVKKILDLICIRGNYRKKKKMSLLRDRGMIIMYNVLNFDLLIKAC